ncbi:MAG: stage II sporulation protein P [Clostridiaceae bacterium]|nr:stage II sporulation protein P [Clostridiaceae bacterium]
MYQDIIRRKRAKPKINIIVAIIVVLIGIFAFRVINVLRSNTERGGFAYVELLNFGMPVVETQVYDEGAYAENNLSIKAVLLQALGLNNIDNLSIINTEVSFFKQGFTGIDLSTSNTTSSLDIDSFNINDNTVLKAESNADVENEALKKALDSTKPEVLIYHSHTTESYAETSGDSLDENHSVVGVANVIEKELEENYGISVIHDKTNHSISYNDSYKRSRETVQKYLKEYGDFKIIIDLHRDSVPKKNAVTGTVNGENIAKLMFVLTKNSARYGANQALADEMRDKANELFPGLMRGNGEYTYNSGMNQFNLGLSDGSMLIEVGSEVNTAEESQNSGKFIARLIAEHINGKK